ncbi:MAG: molecular chaperone HtpG [Armatimonadetes bacterium]|nr:molecular chaperone HtpG [Armatimonadota bacterium]
MSNTVERLEFQAEAKQLLHLMVHSIYSNKDIFLRELISNASDALDKLRLESLTNKDLKADTSDLHVMLEADKEARTLTVRDNGIGMSRDEVIGLIGTIAKSGTAEFLKQVKETRDQAASAELIGQFGVGFYSTFMVADKVTLVTRHAGQSQGTRWESTGDGTYTIEDVEMPPQGTSITLHLKPVDSEDGVHDYTDEWTVRSIVKKYSDFISYPIKMDVEKSTWEDGKETKSRAVETLNSMKALWARPKDEVKPEEYKEFYKHISHDWNDPLRTIHMKAEGTFEYESLLFVPSRAPMDLYMRDGRRGLQLYVKRVFIMDDCEELMPEYLRFVKGVVDAADLSLNVSREILQKDRQIQQMRRRLVKKVLSDLESIRDDAAEEYATFWHEFGRCMKEGLYGDPENREALLDLARFNSTQDEGGLIALKDYLGRMKEGQEAIYYLTGETRASVENSPHLEAFKAKGIEVLLLTDPIDELWVSMVGQYQGKSFQSAGKGEVTLGGEEEKAEQEERKKDFASLLSWMASKLSEVKEVRLSTRLTASPACVVGDQYDVTPNLEKMMRAMGQDVPEVKRILELNPEHPLVVGLKSAYDERKDDPQLAEVAELLFGLSILAEGGELKDPARFSKVLAETLTRAI